MIKEFLNNMIDKFNELIDGINKLQDHLLKHDGSVALKVWFQDGTFQMWEKFWRVPRTGDHITKDDNVYEVREVNYYTGTICFVEIWVVYKGHYKVGGLLK